MHISFIVFGVFESHIWQTGKPLSFFCPPKVFTWSCTDWRAPGAPEALQEQEQEHFGQQGEVLSTEVPHASSTARGQTHPWLGQCRAGTPGTLWAPVRGQEAGARAQRRCLLPPPKGGCQSAPTTVKTMSRFCLWKGYKFQSTSSVIDPFFLPLFQLHCGSKRLEMPRDLTLP